MTKRARKTDIDKEEKNGAKEKKNIRQAGRRSHITGKEQVYVPFGSTGGS